jgi:hypothetical protein
MLRPHSQEFRNAPEELFIASKTRTTTPSLLAHLKLILPMPRSNGLNRIDDASAGHPFLARSDFNYLTRLAPSVGIMNSRSDALSFPFQFCIEYSGG